MITRLKAVIYIATDNTKHETLADCQRHELIQLLTKESPPESRDDLKLSPDHVAAILVHKQEEVLDILSTTGRSKPKLRKINGAVKKRTPKTPAA